MGPSPGDAQALVDFLNAAWTPFHAVDEARKVLLAAGFKHLQEKDKWDVVPGGRYFFTRNATTIVAFAVGQKYVPGNGFYMIGAHTDSPCLKLKPVSKSTKSDCLMLNVETYGGGLWNTWFDRELGIAGRVLLRAPDGLITQRLVKIAKPIARIPMLAIHLQTASERSEGFKINAQNHLAPLLATNTKAKAVAPQPAAASAAKPADAGADAAAPAPERHHPLLLSLLADQLRCSPDEIVDLELHLCDTQPSVIGGACNEFIFSGRLDNLAMSFCSLTALIRSCGGGESSGGGGAGALAEETGVRAVALFDHEEVGSGSAQGAGGPVMRDTITRVARALSGGEEGAAERCLRCSFLVSADMAHAVHPNYADKHDPHHGPAMHKGLVVKYNGNQRYATNTVSASVFRELGTAQGVPCQEFAVRNDMPCGSTIGPILASSLGCLTVDVGIPQWAMHSIRETCGTDDVSYAIRHFEAFFGGVGRMLAGLDVDSLPPPELRGEIDDPSCHHCAS
ncbi:hypothetical protein PLESTB_000156400 [Pleodorina starrii]|uniref:aspartyl aminopeptidase n=1 Tax=Pleodorina starrii TaxID=330485 RepID=A0A9W6BBS6_9CHLO|nr:hypothetical protein PLESTM_000454800 [Pleodorina starrii]GLC48860.1 hypothetical protein PLESTB_000156400 [Pleodorina starrii]GLC72588.1 hypothetical protein PLESTF_001267700 [Pleodorina starrii]